MIKSLLFICLLSCNWSLLAQTNLELNIQHKLGQSTYVPGQPYLGENNRVILINRIQYYLSNIELIHDGNQSSIPNNRYFLIDGETSSYNLGTVSSTIQDLEWVNFNLGIGPSANVNVPATYVSGHPLAEGNMYSNDQQSYIFIAIEGMVDTDGDQIPDKPFQLRATGDQLLRSVSIEANTSMDNNTLKIDLVANIAGWLKEIDLESVGNQENSGAETEKVCDNTNDHGVFYNVSTTSVNTLVSPKNHIHIDSRLAIAPTIYYKFYTLEQLDITITNTSGTYFIQRFNLAPEGDFYMSDELASGVYIVIFTTPKGVRQCKRFVIRN